MKIGGSRAKGYNSRNKILICKSLPTPFYWFCTFLARRILRYSAKIHVLGKENAPPSEPFVFVSNHISHFDPVLISCLVPKPIRWLATKELFENRLANKFLQLVGGITIDRSRVDTGALRTATHHIEGGSAVGIFPEGGIRSGKNSILEGAPGKPGFATLSILSRAPILPCAILGTDRLYKMKYWSMVNKIFSKEKQAPIWIAFGKPIQPSSTLSRKEARDQIHQETVFAIQSLAQSLIKHFQLRPEDLPQTARERK